MKLYDFHCKGCGCDFEDLVREVSDARCPGCASSDVEKQLSAFAVGGSRGDTPAPSGGCASGSCCGGSCGLN